MTKSSQELIKIKINDICTRGVSDVIKQGSVKNKLLSGKKLRIKHGVDPTTADLHLGYYAIHRKLKKLQELGHTIVFLVGDFTARFGDPTGKMTVRDERTSKEIRILAKQLIKQLDTVLDISKTEIRYNSEWYEKMSTEEFVRTLRGFSVWRLLERDLFQERQKRGKELKVSEFIYPILQAYDSVQLKSDLTVIGSDQIFNELQARVIQEQHGQEPQDLIATKLLVGTDGAQKMSQSLNNYISFQDSPSEQFGKIMSIPDSLIDHYTELLTDIKIFNLEKSSEEPHRKKQKHRDSKLQLAYTILEDLHGKKIAEEAKNSFVSVFQKREIPKEILIYEVLINTPLRNVMHDSGLSSSLSESIRLIKQGGVRIDGVVVKDWDFKLNLEKIAILRVGRRKFLKLVPKGKKISK